MLCGVKSNILTTVVRAVSTPGHSQALGKLPALGLAFLYLGTLGTEMAKPTGWQFPRGPGISPGLETAHTTLGEKLLF